MESPTDTFRRWFHRWFRQWKCHVTVQLSRFESVGHSVGKIVWKKSTSPHRCNFPNKLYRPSAIRSVYTDKLISSIYTDHIADGRIPSVYTDRVGDEIIYIGKNYRRKNSIGFRRFSGSGICVLHRRNNFIGKIVKCCSESLLTARV
jgi:hypothetical protein